MKNMINVLFICHGNICRSVMAEYILKDKIEKNNLSNIIVSSKAVSNEEEGNDIYFKAKNTLDNHHIKYGVHHAHQVTVEEMNKATFIFIMDSSNYNCLNRMFTEYMEKVKYLNNEIEDPWYTNNFEKVFNQIEEGIDNFLQINI